MTLRLHWKLMLLTTVPVIAVIIGIIWFAFNQLAADYFMVLMDKYMVSPTETHRAFLSAIHYYLFWASVLALILAFMLSYLMTRRVLHPLVRMSEASRQIAAGDFATRIDVTANDEIGELGAAFNLMGDSLEKIELLRKSMVADVAHELRTPLTNLRGYLEGLSDGIIAPDREIFEMLQQENLRLVSLVDGLGQLARADAARAYLEKKPIDLIACISEILTLYGMNFDEKQIDVVTHLAERAIVQADRDKMLQTIRNLVENCWKYTPYGGQVTINSTSWNNEIRIEFINSGPGIAVKDIPLIFERFFTADPSRSREAGEADTGTACFPRT